MPADDFSPPSVRTSKYPPSEKEAFAPCRTPDGQARISALD
jgi:hypothetical protein